MSKLFKRKYLNLNTHINVDNLIAVILRLHTQKTICSNTRIYSYIQEDLLAIHTKLKYLYLSFYLHGRR